MVGLVESVGKEEGEEEEGVDERGECLGVGMVGEGEQRVSWEDSDGWRVGM